MGRPGQFFTEPPVTAVFDVQQLRKFQQISMLSFRWQQLHITITSHSTTQNVKVYWCNSLLKQWLVYSNINIYYFLVPFRHLPPTDCLHVRLVPLADNMYVEKC